MTRIDITNIDKVSRFMAELPKKEEKVLARSNIRMIKGIKRTAKLMAPRDTGELADSIRERSTKVRGKTHQYFLAVTAPHARAQEDGFTPHFAFIRNSSKLPPGLYFVKKNTPFIKPAIEKNFSRFSQDLNNGIKEATKI